LIDMGPGAGAHGGQVVSTGSPEQVMRDKKSLTGAYLSGAKRIPMPPGRRTGTGEYVTIKGARENNLKDIDVTFPLGQFICITGRSGSGKSPLVSEILYKRAAQTLYQARDRPGQHDALLGLEQLDKV